MIIWIRLIRLYFSGSSIECLCFLSCLIIADINFPGWVGGDRVCVGCGLGVGFGGWLDYVKLG